MNMREAHFYGRKDNLLAPPWIRQMIGEPGSLQDFEFKMIIGKEGRIWIR